MKGKAIMQVCIAFVFLGEFSVILFQAAYRGEQWAIELMAAISIAILAFFGFQVVKNPEDTGTTTTSTSSTVTVTPKEDTTIKMDVK